MEKVIAYNLVFFLLAGAVLSVLPHLKRRFTGSLQTVLLTSGIALAVFLLGAALFLDLIALGVIGLVPN